MREKDILAVVNSGKIKLRDGAEKFFKLLIKNNIPLIILSATGLGEVIPLFLKKEKLWSDNVFALTNTFQWDAKGRAIKINEPIIHSLNKEESMVSEFPAQQKTKGRKNIILLGDSIDDANMAHGFKYDNIIKISFLNEKVEERLPHYKKIFDAIILNDGSFNFVNELLRELVQAGRPE